MSVYSPSGSGSVHVDKVISGRGSAVPYEIRMDGSRHCVYKKGTDQKMGCHDSHDAAQRQVAALYANEGSSNMSDEISYLVNLDGIQLAEVANGNSSSWVHALPIGSYKHPVWGTLDFSKERIQRFSESVKKKIRGIDPSINYTHNNNEAAAGWVKDAEARSDGLWFFVEWVQAAAEKIKKKEFRYFSAEFYPVWEDPQGNKFNDVVFGGALTNRPFMKNLVPINLSEATVDNAFELVSTITGQSVDDLKGKGNMELSEEALNKIIEGVTTKLKEGVKPTAATPPPLSEIVELKQLAEENSTVAALLHHFETQGVSLHEATKELRETQVVAKLAEFDNSKLTLSPSAKQLLHDIMVDPGMSVELSEKLWQLMEQVRTSQSFLVELGERSGAGVRYGHGMVEKSATVEFTERTNRLMAEEKMSFLEAADKVAKDDPQLFARYRAGDGAPASK